MAKSSEEVIFEGWLTKSPPTKRIWRARWRRRWFLLTHSGDIPGQYILTYYTDRNRRKLKGVIDLDRCEQVDLGLKLEERNLKFDHVFDIKTPNRTYYLAADTEEEMKSWVTCICRVCGLKSTNEDDDTGLPMKTPDIEITEENSIQVHETPPISPVSTSPYIPISECITGKSPVFDPKDFKTLFEYNQRHSRFNQSATTHHNDIYNSYVNFSEADRNYVNDPERNYVNDLQDPRFYDCPRQLVPKGDKNPSPLLSPTDSDSVFNDEECPPKASDNQITRPSDSSADLEPVASEKFTKTDKVAPPRPPKPAHITPPPPCYLNLTAPPVKRSKDGEMKPSAQVVSDDMYDFPRSHNIDTEPKGSTLQRRHCYNNAAPVKCPDGTIFRYDISPKVASVTSVFRYDLEATGSMEPSSPAHSHSSSTPAYSNLPSPLLASESQLMPPPTVNRELKPKRKLSDTHSTSSNTEPPSPRNLAPSVDRKLKPPTPLQEASMRKSFHLSDEDGMRKIRAAPSPTPPGVFIDDPYQNEAYQYINKRMQYLDLDLEGASSSGSIIPKPVESDTVYKKVDFMKTEAFNITRSNLEKDRQEPVTSFVKK